MQPLFESFGSRLRAALWPTTLAVVSLLLAAGLGPIARLVLIVGLPDLAGATDTEFATGNASTVKRWASELWVELPEQVFWAQYMGGDSNAIIEVKKDFEGQPGDVLTFTLARQLSGAGVTGDNTLEGQEEAILFYTDTVTLNQYRNAVRLKGKLSERRTAFSQRTTAKALLKDWLADHVDDKVFTALSTSPSSARAIYGGSAVSTATIGANDLMTLSLITKAKTLARKAAASGSSQIFPTKIEGNEYFLLVMSPDAMHDLKTLDPQWSQAQREAQTRGTSNPLFTGAEGIWDGVVLRSSIRVATSTTWGAGANIPGSENLFCGRQAGVFAWGMKPNWVEKEFDYGNSVGFAIAAIYDVTKAVFNAGAGPSDQDHGLITVRTARTNVA